MDSVKATAKEAVEAVKDTVAGEGEEKGPSKRALEKERKKAEKAAKKAEHKQAGQASLASRPKQTPADAAPKDPTAVFDEGWLKRVYEEKPVGRGKVRTRFPPEPNGYLHIGHAKAIAVNFGFAKHHDGICFLRFDDTNPEKEEEAFFTSIREIVEWLGFKPYQITHSSDHFDKLYDLACELIRRDKAYVCHCTKEEINMGRGGPDNKGKRFACAHRGRPVDESLREFEAMKEGKYKPGEANLRMKQSITDDAEGNPQMWDLTAYRITKNHHHARTGDKWKIYPTYDYTHCICDAFEEITHSLCTTEFYLSRTSYDWLLEQLDMKLPKSDEKGPMQREYGRLNVTGTILSKRRIQSLVEGLVKKDEAGKVIETIRPPAVRGWDDPRLFTLVALRRRGIPAAALLSFVSELGVTDALTNIQVVRFESGIRKFLERTVPRLMLVLDPIPVTITDLPDDYTEDLRVPFDPKNPDSGSRIVSVSSKIYIDRSDFRSVDDPNFFRLAPGKTVGLLNAPFLIKAESFETDAAGKVTSIKAVKIPTETEKPKAFIHWVDAKSAVEVVARQYNQLFKTDEPNSLDWSGGGYFEDLNPDSEVSYTGAVVERAIGELVEKHKVTPGVTSEVAADGSSEHKLDKTNASDDLVRFQAVRTAYFCVDRDKEDGKLVLNQIVSLKEDKSK